MGKNYSYSFAVGSWENRQTLPYTPAGDPDAEGRKVDNYGRIICAGLDPSEPPLRTVEDNGTLIYMKYAAAAAIIKITVE